MLSIILIGVIHTDDTMITFRTKVCIKNHPQSRDIINKFLPRPLLTPHSFSRKRIKKLKRIFSFLFILPWKMMEVRVGVIVVLLKFSVSKRKAKEKPQVKQNEKFTP